MTGALGELHKLETFDGQTLIIPSTEVAFLVFGNYGAPPIDFITRRGYKQHGVIEVDYLLNTRSLNVELWYKPGCTRQEYWDNRQLLLDFLRPNRNGPMTLTLHQPDGSERALVVRANPGLTFPPNQQDNNSWNVDEPLEFIAFDPVWFDPTAVSLALTGTTSGNLVFPITFDDLNIVFGEAGLLFDANIVYTGTWPTYPLLTFTGPYTSVKITHLETGVVLTLNVAVVAGQTRILDLTPGQQSLVDASGNNHFGDLGPLSNLVDFNIRPNPELAGGVNTLQFEVIDGVVGVSGVTVRYTTRYIAI